MKIYSLLLIMFVSLQLEAQQKFIEVTVSDTVQVMADIFVYRIVMPPAYMDVTYDKGVTMPKSKTTKSGKKPVNQFDSVVSRLKKMGYHFLPLSIKDNYNALPAFTGNTATILLHSPDSLSQLSTYIKKQEPLMGTLETAIAENEGLYYDKLYKKLVDAAIEKAKRIAVYSNLRVTGILSVIEGPAENPAEGGWTSYPPLSALGESSVVPGWHTTIRPAVATDMYPISIKLIVRLSVE